MLDIGCYCSYLRNFKIVDLFIELFIASPDLLQPNNNQHNNNESYWAIEHPRARGPCQCCASASVRTLSLQSVESQQAARHHQWPVDKPIQCTSVPTPHSIHSYLRSHSLLAPAWRNAYSYQQVAAIGTSLWQIRIHLWSQSLGWGENTTIILT